MTTLDTYILMPMKDMFHTVIGVLPMLVSVFITLVIGYVLARILRDLLTRLFKEAHLDKVADKLGLSKVLHAGGVKHTLSHLIGSVVYLIVVFMFLIMTVRIIGIDTFGGVISSMLAYTIPVIVAVFVLVVGHIVAHIIGKTVHAVVSNYGLPKPKLHERVCRWAIILYAVKMSLTTLGYGILFSGTVFHIWFAGLILALSLAFGLGGRDAAAKYLAKK